VASVASGRVIGVHERTQAKYKVPMLSEDRWNVISRVWFAVPVGRTLRRFLIVCSREMQGGRSNDATLYGFEACVGIASWWKPPWIPERPSNA